MFRKLLASAAAIVAPTAAHAEWQVATSKHFVVYANDSAEHVKAYTERLETFDKAMRVWHVSPEDQRGPSARVTVFVVDNTSEIQKLAGNRFVAGFYQPRAGESVAFTPRSSGSNSDYGLTAQAILLHEYTHHWMLANDEWADAAFPAWFTEGFAELHATAIFRDGGVIFGAQPTYRRYTIERMNLLPAEQLLKPNPGNLSPQQLDALYARGWLLTDYLYFDPDRRAQLAAYIGAINAGKPIDEATALLGNVSSLDLKMNSWARKAVQSAFIPADQLKIGDVEIRALSPAETAIMPAFIISKSGVNTKTAEDNAALARVAAARFPNDPFVQNELAEAEYDVCSVDGKSDAACYARADAAADRALATDPKSVHALLYKGMIQEQIAKKNRVADPSRWRAIRRWFLDANKVDSEAPQPLIEFYNSFRAAKETPSKNAESGLLYAYALAPYDKGLRSQAAYVLLGQGKAPEAKVALGPVAYDAENPEGAERAQKVLTVLKTDGPAAALAEIDKKREEDEKKADGADNKKS